MGTVVAAAAAPAIDALVPEKHRQVGDIAFPWNLFIPGPQLEGDTYFQSRFFLFSFCQYFLNLPSWTSEGVSLRFILNHGKYIVRRNH